MEDSGFRRRSHRSSNNIQDGYTPVDEEYLQQSGIRGWKSCCFCSLLVVLLLVAIMNALVTVGLVYFMSITHEGMKSLELLPGSHLIRILTNSYASRIKTNSGLIGGRFEKDVEISSEMGTVLQTGTSQVVINGSETTLTSDDFNLHTSSGKTFFSTNASRNFVSYEVTNLHALQIDVGSISARSGIAGLNIESLNRLELAGMEGVSISTDGHTLMDAKKAITITSLYGGITLQSEDGVYMDPGLPTWTKGAVTPTISHYKLCVCMPSGKLFAVLIVGPEYGCHTANEDVNPCQT